MDLGLKGKTALLGASSKGLGKASALALAREGVRVALCARGEEALKAAEKEMKEAGAAEVLTVAADLTKRDDVDRVLDRVLEHFGHVDILFTNNGGPPAGYFMDFDDDTWVQSVDQTLMSTVRMIRGILPGMQENRWGRIICCTSIVAIEPWDNMVLSNSIRAGVHGLAKTLSTNYAADGITVNCIVPGPIHTDRIDSLAKTRAEREGITFEEALSKLGQFAAMKRLGRVEEFGDAVAFLASENASFITGSSLRIDGGGYRALV